MAEPTAETRALLARMVEDFAGAPADPTVEQRREGLRVMADLYGPEPAPVARVEDRSIPGPAGSVPVRIYHPPGATGPVPLILHVHGGGWVLGDPTAYERVCRAYCAAAGAVVVDVHYRRAPEHKYPAALRDCEAALVWAHAAARGLGADPRRIVVTGDSAGGNLAAALCQRTRVPVALQVLVYPVMSASARADFASRGQLGDGRFFLREFDIKRAESEYLARPAHGEQAGVSPLLAPDRVVRRVPRALIITAELDPLRDEGEAYARRLRALGVPVGYDCAPGSIHGFVLFAGALEQGRETIARIGAAVRALPARRPGVLAWMLGERRREAVNAT
ncbi:alpha/beta hydrolase [Caulobacter sp. 17J65-9]|uniref:alpha/beta hydrolase n=1 Tax=Caulobacter sp. 17J65-9 TaxID=2709382 RepID=UPI0013CA181A|nr:alpha/beta hydrolase [Caulobacter sp. 17J65-9]NEX94788.1 alpha/beta hydrolase [Caulobacter sp. 17J65-9]